jgi:hypothetical protein
MKKSKIVSYTSDELKQMPSESDWAAADAMTQEEILAAIASDPEEAALNDGWMKRATVVRPKPPFVMCISNKDYEHDLILHKVYKDISTEKEAQDGWVRVVDETGEDYLYYADCFVPVQIPEKAEKSFELDVA